MLLRAAGTLGSPIGRAKGRMGNPIPLRIGFLRNDRLYRRGVREAAPYGIIRHCALYRQMP